MSHDQIGKTTRRPGHSHWAATALTLGTSEHALCCTAYVCCWPCAPTARIISGGRFHPESCRLIR